jgi:predicted transcriptional regulator
MSEPVKVLPMAKLLRLAKEKEERERAEREGAGKTFAAAVIDEPLATQTDEPSTDSETRENPQLISEQPVQLTGITSLGIVPPTILREVIPVNENLSNPTQKTGEGLSDSGGVSEKRVPGRDVTQSALSHQTIPRQTIPGETLPKEVPSRRDTIGIKVVDPLKGYYPVFNDISDRLIPELRLDPYEQSVLQRLYRLSRGWKKEECEVGLGTLAKQCVMSRSQVQRSIAKLMEKGLIENLGSIRKGGKEGNRYRVLAGIPFETGKNSHQRTSTHRTIPQETISVETMVYEEGSRFNENTEVSPGIVRENTNKNKDKDLKNNTHTKAGVRVGSKFTIEECRRYAEHLRSTGQGINNPGGYATTIHRTGEADLLIENFLRPEAADPASNLNASQCPACNGTGFYYPQGVEAGVARCKHEQLRKEGSDE